MLIEYIFSVFFIELKKTMISNIGAKEYWNQKQYAAKHIMEERKA